MLTEREERMENNWKNNTTSSVIACVRLIQNQGSPKEVARHLQLQGCFAFGAARTKPELFEISARLFSAAIVLEKAGNWKLAESILT